MGGHATHQSTLKHSSSVEGVSWGCEGEVLAVGGGEHVSLWRRLSGVWRQIGLLQIANCISTVYSTSMAGLLCAMGGTGGIAVVWSLAFPTEDDDMEGSVS